MSILNEQKASIYLDFCGSVYLKRSTIVYSNQKNGVNDFFVKNGKKEIYFGVLFYESGSAFTTFGRTDFLRNARIFNQTKAKEATNE